MGMRSAQLKIVVQALLLVILCVASYLIPFRMSYSRGYQEAPGITGGKPVSEAYFLGDLVEPNGPYPFTELQALLMRIHATTWDWTGGQGTVEVLHDAKSNPILVIYNYKGVHDDIAALFTSLRASREPRISVNR